MRTKDNYRVKQVNDTFYPQYSFKFLWMTFWITYSCTEYSTMDAVTCDVEYNNIEEAREYLRVKIKEEDPHVIYHYFL